MPLAVSTCGANTTAGLTRAMAAVTSSIGAGDQGACGAWLARRALSTVMWPGAVIWPISRTWLQR